MENIYLKNLHSNFLKFLGHEPQFLALGGKAPLSKQPYILCLQFLWKWVLNFLFLSFTKNVRCWRSKVRKKKMDSVFWWCPSSIVCRCSQFIWYVFIRRSKCCEYNYYFTISTCLFVSLLVYVYLSLICLFVNRQNVICLSTCLVMSICPLFVYL